MTASRHWLTWTLCVRIFVYLIRIVALGRSQVLALVGCWRRRQRVDVFVYPVIRYVTRGRSQVLAVGAGLCFVCFEFLYERARVNFRECLIEGEKF